MPRVSHSSSSWWKKLFSRLLWSAVPACIAVYFVGQFWSQQQRFARWQRAEAVRAALQARAPNLGSSPDSATLEDELKRIAPAFPVPLVLDQQLGREAAHVLGNESQNIVFGEEYGTLQGSLSHLVQQALASDVANGICFRCVNGKVVVQTAVKREWPRVTRFHPFPVAGPEEHAWTEEEITLFIWQTVPLSDQESKSRDWIQSAPSGLLITTTEETQERIGWLLKRLRPLASTPASLAPQPLFLLEPGMPGYATTAILDEPLEMEKFSGTVAQGLAEIARRKKIPILVARSANWKMEDNFDWLDQKPKTLRELLAQTWVSFRLGSQGLTVVTLTEVERAQTSICYPVHDLVGLPPARITPDELVAAINKRLDQIARDPFGEHPRILLSDRWVLARAREPEHAVIATFLSHLRTALARGSASAGNTPPVAERIDARLARSYRFGFSSMPLGEFCRILEKELGCQVECKPEFADLNFKLWNDEEALGKILDDSLFVHDLTYQLISGELHILGEKEVPKGQVAYDVRTLTEPGAGLLTQDGLIRLLKSEINPGTWREAFGSGEIDALGGLLLIDNNTSTQWRIRAFLNYLRDHQADLPRLSEFESDPRLRRAEIQRLQQRLEKSTNWCEQRYLRFVLTERGALDVASVLAE